MDTAVPDRPASFPNALCRHFWAGQVSLHSYIPAARVPVPTERATRENITVGEYAFKESPRPHLCIVSFCIYRGKNGAKDNHGGPFSSRLDDIEYNRNATRMAGFALRRYGTFSVIDHACGKTFVCVDTFTCCASAVLWITCATLHHY